MEVSANMTTHEHMGTLAISIDTGFSGDDEIKYTSLSFFRLDHCVAEGSTSFTKRTWNGVENEASSAHRGRGTESVPDGRMKSCFYFEYGVNSARDISSRNKYQPIAINNQYQPMAIEQLFVHFPVSKRNSQDIDALQQRKVG